MKKKKNLLNSQYSTTLFKRFLMDYWFFHISSFSEIYLYLKKFICYNNSATIFSMMPELYFVWCLSFIFRLISFTM